MADKKRFSEDFAHWNEAIPESFRCMVENPFTGEEYWVTREQFVTGVTIGSNGGASAYQIYAATTSDNPVLSETDWINSLYGEDGVTPTIGSNGNWFIGTTDTGVKAQPENPIPVAQVYNAPMGAVLFFVGQLSSLSDSWHLADGSFVEGFGNTIDMRGKVPLGYDPRTFAEPVNTTGLVKNYGAIGNTGGKSFVTLTTDQIPAHDHHYAGFDQLMWKAPNGTYTSKTTDTTVGEPDIVHSGTIQPVGKDQAHENRMEYVVGAYIQRVKPEVVTGGGNGKSAYQSYLDTTTDNPKLTEAEWVESFNSAPEIYVGTTTPTEESIKLWIDTTPPPPPVNQDVELLRNLRDANPQSAELAALFNDNTNPFTDWWHVDFDNVYNSYGALFGSNPILMQLIQLGMLTPPAGYPNLQPDRVYMTWFYHLPNLTMIDLSAMTYNTMGFIS